MVSLLMLQTYKLYAFLWTPLLIPFEIPRQGFFLDTRRQKRSLASLNEHFGNAVAEKKPKLENKMELLEVFLFVKKP